MHGPQHLDKLYAIRDGDVAALRKAQIAKRREAPKENTKDNVGMLAPRSGMFKATDGTEYHASYEGEEIPVWPIDVSAMLAHGFRVLPDYSKSAPSDADLLRKGMAAQMRREPHSIGNPDPRSRTEFGSVVVSEHGALMISIDEGSDALSIHGINTLLSDLPAGLRQAALATSAYFNAAFSASEQLAQKEIISVIVGEILRRDQKLAERVKARVDELRYTAV
jgi:hypothetical protein